MPWPSLLQIAGYEQSDQGTELCFGPRQELAMSSHALIDTVLLAEQLHLSQVQHSFSKASLWSAAVCLDGDLYSRGATGTQNAREEYLSNADLKAVIRSFTSSLKSCAKKKDLHRGKALHADIRDLGLLAKSNRLENTLISMYAKCGALEKAQQILYERSDRDVVSWNALIAGYIQHQKGEDAITCYEKMRSKGLPPDAFTYSYILKACTMIIGGEEIGRKLHEKISAMGLMDNDAVLGNAIVDMYVKCGNLRKAQEALLELPIQNVVTWSTLISGYAQQGQGIEALRCFECMQNEGLSPNAVTYACALRACGITKDFGRGKEIHGEVAEKGLLEIDIVLGNAVLDMYVKCGALTNARKVFEEMPAPDVVSWSAMIAGHVQHMQGEVALECFQEMCRRRVAPNSVTYAVALKACGMTGNVDMGAQIHDEIDYGGLLEGDAILGTALVDMLSKFGLMAKAQTIFDELTVRDGTGWNALISGYAQQGQKAEAFDCTLRMRIEGFLPDLVCWNALIGVYAQQGLAQEAVLCFHEMQVEGTCPDSVTFVNILNACSHAGLVDEGQMCFETMVKEYGIVPDNQHHTCMVDLFGRARHFEEALRVIEKMPFLDYPPVWFAFLSAGRGWMDAKLCRMAFEHAAHLGGINVSLYALINAYATAGHGNRGTSHHVFFNIEDPE